MQGDMTSEQDKIRTATMNGSDPAPNMPRKKPPMHRMNRSAVARSLAISRRGAGVSNYGLALGLIVVVALFAVSKSGEHVRNMFASIPSDLAAQTGSGNNSAPVWVTGSSLQLATGQSYSKALQATDADGDDITFSIASGDLPAGISLTGDTLAGTPAADGQSDVTFLADDGKGGTS